MFPQPKIDTSSIRRIDTYTGVTAADGTYTVTYPAPFDAVPILQPEPPTAGNQVWIKVTSTVNGFTLKLVQRSAVTILGLDVLLAATINVASADARVAVIAT